MLSGGDWTDYKFEVIHENSIYITMNRNNAASKFMQDDRYSDFDYLFFWDADNGLTPEAFGQFMKVMVENPEVNILSGSYYRKTPNMIAVHGVMFPDSDAFLSDVYMFEGAGLVDLTNFNGKETRGMLGTGCMMVRREVFSKVEYPWFDTNVMFLKSQGRWTHQTEDSYFCTKAQDAGYHVHLDTSIRSPHYAGGECFPPEWHQWVEEEEPEEREIPTLGFKDFKITRWD
jgi:GT2 family glycosyltransferase